MFNTFFGGGGMGGMGGSGQQKFKMNMGGGGMGGGGMGGGGIEELLMGGMCICHAICCAVLSIMCRACLWHHDVLLHHVAKTGHGAIVECSHPSQADHTSLHTPYSITMHLTAVIMLQAEASLAHFNVHVRCTSSCPGSSISRCAFVTAICISLQPWGAWAAWVGECLEEWVGACQGGEEAGDSVAREASSSSR